MNKFWNVIKTIKKVVEIISVVLGILDTAKKEENKQGKKDSLNKIQ